METVPNPDPEAARLRLAVHAANVGLWEWEPASGQAYFSPEWKRQAGCGDHEVGRTFEEWRSRLHPDEAARVLKTLQTCLEQPWEDYQDEYRFRHRDGSYRWMLARGTVVADVTGRVTRFVGAHLDITGQKQAEAALRHSRDWAEDIINSVDGIVWEADPETFIFSFVSQQAETILGYPAARWLAEPTFWVDRLHPEDRERAVAFCLNETRAGRSHQFEYRMLAADGRVVWFKDLVTVVRDAGPKAKLRGIMVDITERKQAEDAMCLAEAKYRSIFENAVDGIFQSTPDGRFLAANPAMARILGFVSQEQLLAERTDIARQGYASPAVRKAFERLLLEHGQISGFEYEALRRDGTRIWVSESARAVRDAAGNLVCYEGTMKDISEHKRTEQSLRTNEEKFLAFFEASPDAIIIADRAGTIHLVNRQAEQLFGYARAELVGQTIETLMPRRFPAGHHEALRAQYLREPHLRPMGEGRDLFARRKDGTEFPADISLSPITTPEGLLIISTIRDITKRKQAEEQLRQAEAKYRSIFDHATEGIIQTTPDGRILTANATMARLLGYDSAEQLLNADLLMDRDIYARPEDRAAFVRLLDEGGPSADFQCQFRRHDGRMIWVSMSGRVVRDTGGVPLYYEGTCVDVTERRRLEDELRQSQKMEAMGQLAGGIAHDFNNILTAIMGNAELLRILPADSREAAESLESVLAGARRATDLVRQILTFSRRQEARRQPVQLHLIVREVMQLLRATLPTSIEFRTSLPETPTVLADALEIHQVAMNLCTNAWQAMRDQPGSLVVALAELEVDDAFARRNPDLSPGRYVQLTVGDTGCGMTTDTQARIFEPFFTTKPVGEGTGLGLAVVHGIVKRHDGAILVESEPGRGTTFSLFFPVFLGEAAEPPDDPQPVPRGRGERVLIVDDEEPLARMAKAALERLGYRATASTSSVEALTLFRADPAAFDLVITDLNMPGLNGKELAAQLLALRRDARLVLTTGFSAHLTPAAVRELGFCDLLPKPYDLRSLGRVTHRALNETTLTRRP